MAAYTEAQLNQIYSYLGFNFYVDFEPEVASVIRATQAVADGGTRPDTSLQTQVLAICSSLACIDQNLLNLMPLDGVVESSTGAKYNASKGDFLLRRQGKKLIQQLCIIFALKGVRQNYYGSPRLVMDDGGMSRFPYGY